MVNLWHSTYPVERFAYFSIHFYTFIFAEWVTISNYGIDYTQLTDSGPKNSRRDISFVDRNVLYTIYI